MSIWRPVLAARIRQQAVAGLAEFRAVCIADGENRLSKDKDEVTQLIPQHSATTGDGEARPPDFSKYSAVTAVNAIVAKSVGNARPPRFAERSATTADATAVATTVAKTVGNARPPRIAEHSATTKSVLAEPPGELGGGEARHPGIAKYMATTKSVLAQPSGEFHCEVGRSWSRTSGTSSAAASTVVKPANLGLLRSQSVVPCKILGWVKRWFNDRSFGFITPEDGAEDVCIHWKQVVGTKVLRQGGTVSDDTENDERKGKYKAVNCIVTRSGGGGKHVSGDDDMSVRGKQLADTEGLRLRNTVSHDTADDDRNGNYDPHLEVAARRLWDPCGKYWTSSYQGKSSVVTEMWSPVEDFCNASQCQDIFEVVRG